MSSAHPCIPASVPVVPHLCVRDHADSHGSSLHIEAGPTSLPLHGVVISSMKVWIVRSMVARLGCKDAGDPSFLFPAYLRRPESRKMCRIQLLFSFVLCQSDTRLCAPSPKNFRARCRFSLLWNTISSASGDSENYTASWPYKDIAIHHMPNQVLATQRCEMNRETRLIHMLR